MTNRGDTKVTKEEKNYISACDLLIKELGRIRNKLSRKVTVQQEKHKESINEILKYKSEEEILDAYGWGYITQAQYDYELKQFRLGEAALSEEIQTKETSALMLIQRFITDIEFGKAQAIFDAMSPEEQNEELKRGEAEEKARKKRAEEAKKEMEGVIL